MPRENEDIFSNHVKANSTVCESDYVTRVLKSFDTFSLTPVDLRGEETKLKKTLQFKKDEILREQQITKKLNSEIEKLESEYLTVLKEKQVTEVNTEKIRNEKIPCKEDEETLTKLKEKLRLFKDITKIRWDYSAPNKVIKGYICGPTKNYVHAFEIPLNDSEATSRVWQEIENASLKASHNSKGKENIAENIRPKKH